jgi:hypothetical protein
MLDIIGLPFDIVVGYILPALLVITIVIFYAFPQIALWLPGYLYR